MSATIKQIAELIDVEAIRRCLFPTDDLRGTESWLQNSLIAISPTGEVIAIARGHKCVVLTAKWDSVSMKSFFSITFTGVLDSKDTISALLCLPIATPGATSEVGPDWTCLVVGFSSGYVRFYTENCNVLAAEQFHDAMVAHIKCQSLKRARPDRGHDTFPEELYIIYPNNICLLNGLNLIQTLRNCRSELAKIQAKGDNCETMGTLPNAKKWGMVDQATVNDAVVVGLDVAPTFDHLLTASTCGGFNSRYRAMAPHNTLVMGVGSKPFVAFHYAIEGGSQPVLSDVAKAVANKLKSALPSWLTGSKSLVEKDSPPMISSEPMGCRFGLCDVRRTANNITLSPDKNLAVVSDALGRIVLIDTRKGICLRVWKGYRDAEYAFVQVQEERPLKRAKMPRTPTRHLKTALFLVIYAPRKGTIDLWVMQQGPKIVTFTASKNSRLLYTDYGIMGSSSIASRNKNNCQFSTVLIDPDGRMKEINIPFHFALSEKNSTRVRDIHLVKKLKQFIKSDDSADVARLCTEIKEACEEIKTTEMRLQCMDMLINTKHIQPPAVMQAVELFLENIAPDDKDIEAEQLLTLCNNINCVSSFYVYTVGEWPEMLDVENGNANLKIEKPKLCATQLSIPQKELDSLQRLLDFSCFTKRKIHNKVSFPDEKVATYAEYLSVFELSLNSKYIALKTNVSEDKLFRISEVIFKSFILCNVLDDVNFKTHVNTSSIGRIDLITLLLSYWIQRSVTVTKNLESEMHSLSKLLYAICQTTPIEDICVHYNAISPFWKKIRDTLVISSHSFQALTAAILCRSVAQKLEHDKELQGSHYSSNSVEEESTMDIWEEMSQDNCQWSLLIGKLEDISMLNIILGSRPVVTTATLPIIDYESEEISYKCLMQKGKGSVSELVAKWLIECGPNPDIIVVNETLDAEVEEAIPEASNAAPPSPKFTRDTQEELQLCESLIILRKSFPYSLEENVLLANITWEYAMHWQKNATELRFLDAVIACIQSIPNAGMRQGICKLVWNTHIRFLLESTSKLINKVGKLPKERLCRQDTNLSDVQLCAFLKVTTEFFSLFLEAVQLAFDCNILLPQYENLWDNDKSTPLTELALQKNIINYDLLHLHYQLCLVLQMIASFNVKHTKPINNLFDSTSAALLFTDLTSNSLVPVYNPDARLMASRMQFLMKVIHSTIEGVRSQNGAIYSSEHIHWMSKCITLGTVWGLESGELRIYQVVQLFQNGFDSLAAELLPTVSETEKLGPALLAIAARRLWLLITDSDDFPSKFASLSAKFTMYLETVKIAEDWCAPSSIEDIETLTGYALRCLSENQREWRLATDLLESLPYL